MEKRSNSVKVFAVLLSMATMIVFSSILAFAQSSQPQGPDTVTISSSGRHNNQSDPYVIQAYAGNVTALVISHTRNTEAWQGYYGNITGTITLDDANNQ